MRHGHRAPRTRRPGLHNLGYTASATPAISGRTYLPETSYPAATPTAVHTRESDLPSANNFFRRQPSSIELLVRAAVGAQSRPFQRDTGEQSFIARVREDFCLHHDVGRALRRSALWTGRSGSISAQFHFAVQQRFGALGIHHQQHEICGLPAQLKSNAHALQSVQRGSSPLAFVMLATAADHHTAPVAAADAESSLLHRGQHYHTFGFVEQDPAECRPGYSKFLSRPRQHLSPVLVRARSLAANASKTRSGHRLRNTHDKLLHRNPPQYRFYEKNETTVRLCCPCISRQ